VKIDHPAGTYAQSILDSDGKEETRTGTGTVYRIVVRGELSARYGAAFDGMEIETKHGQTETKHGQTVLTGEVKDPPHLHGILDRISGFGLELVSVEALPQGTQDSDPGKRPKTTE
jgi:hypothetical protein